MRTKPLCAAWALIMLLVFSQAAICDPIYSGPDDPGVVAAAQKAVAKGQYGAETLEQSLPLSLSAAEVELLGIPQGSTGGESLGLKGSSAGIEGILKELGAKKVGQKVQISLSGDVLFDFDKWNIRPEAEDTLAKVAKAIRGMKVKHVLIEGHTDSKGSDEYNLRLSQLRAASVKSWLVQNGGISSSLIETKGYGELRPVAPNTNPDGSDNPQGRAKNRRVEIYLTVVQ